MTVNKSSDSNSSETNNTENPQEDSQIESTTEETTSNSPDYSEIESRLEAKFLGQIEGLKKELHTALNGVVAKTKAPKKADSGESSSSDPAIEALKAENEEIKASLLQLQEVQKEKDRKLFESKVKDEAHQLLSKYKYDDYAEALEAFTNYYPLSSFIFDKDVIYFSRHPNESKTLASAVKEFHNKLGKRFIIPELTNGAGKNSSEVTTSSGSGEEDLKKNLTAIKQNLQSGKLKLKF